MGAAYLLIAVPLGIWINNRRDVVTVVSAIAIFLLMAGLSLQIVAWLRPEKSPDIPIIAITPAEVADFEAGKRTRIYVNVANAGKGGAYHLKGSVSLGLLPYPFDVKTAFPKSPKSFDSELTVAPGEIHGISGTFDKPLDHSEIDAVLDGSKRRIYVAAVIEYQFASGRPCTRRMLASVGGPEFAQSFAEYKKGGNPNVRGWAFISKYNDVSPGCE